MKKNIWKVILEKSSIQIKIRYMGIGLIVAKFARFEVEIKAENLFKDAEIRVSIESKSVNTQDLSIDKKICSSPFLAANEYPYLLFSALNGCVESPGGILELTGALSVKGIVRPIVMIVNFSDVRKRDSNYTASFNLFGKLNMSDFSIEHPTPNHLEDELFINVVAFLKRVS